MEHYFQVLIEVYSSFGWKEYLCIIGMGILFSASGMPVHIAVKELKEGSPLILSFFFLILALVMFALGCWVASPLWNYPAIEMRITIILWGLIWFLIGLFEPFPKND